MKRLIILAAVLALAGCGARAELKPAPGQALSVAPYGARATPTPTELISPPNQTRPARSVELLTDSHDRTGNEFDLPPD